MKFQERNLDQLPALHRQAVACVSSPLEIIEQGERYSVRRLAWDETERHSAYQRLRASTFVHQLGWNIPVDSQGREHDCYDQREDPSISVHCVYGVGSDTTEHLLGGVRIFALETWNSSMVLREFYHAGMIPDPVIRTLTTHYDCSSLLELTRLCVQHGRQFHLPQTLDSKMTSFSRAVARDLVYAAAYAQAEKTGRWQAIGLADARYLRIMRRSHFVFQELYAWNTDQRSGYALTIIDLIATIHAMRAAGEDARADRMVALCAISM